jgi:hypothetical protein
MPGTQAEQEFFLSPSGVQPRTLGGAQFVPVETVPSLVTQERRLKSLLVRFSRTRDGRIGPSRIDGVLGLHLGLPRCSAGLVVWLPCRLPHAWPHLERGQPGPDTVGSA